MSVLTDLINYAWRYATTQGQPISGSNPVNPPNKTDIINALIPLATNVDTNTAALTGIGASIAGATSSITALTTGLASANANITAIQNAQIAGYSGFATVALLNANLNYAANWVAEVFGDTAANNGFYLKSGASGAGSWTRQRGDPTITVVLTTLAPNAVPTASMSTTWPALTLTLGIPSLTGVTGSTGQLLQALDNAGNVSFVNPSTAFSPLMEQSDGTLPDGSTPSFVFEDVTGFVVATVDTAGNWNFPAQPGIAASGALIDQTETDPNWLMAYTDPGDLICFGIRADNSVFIGPAAYSGLASQTLYPDYMHRVLHGQSLGESDDAFSSANGGLVGLTVVDTGWGNVRFARGFNTWSQLDNPATPAARAASGFVFVGQSAVSGQGESSGVGFADHLKSAGLGSRYAMVDQSSKSPHILTTFGARGSTRLTGINKRDNTGGAAVGTSVTSLTVATGAQTLTTQAGIGTIVATGPVGLVNSANPAIYMAGTVTSYSGTTLVVNITTIQGGGTAATWNIVADNWQLPGGFYATAIDDVTRAHASALALGKTHAVSHVAWMQGERNGDLKIFESDLTVSLMSVAIADYKTRLTLLAGDFDTDIRAITGQLRTIPFLTYQTNYSLMAAEAQLQACASSRDMYMIGPHYAVPSAIQNANIVNGTWRWGADGHLSADGQRWWGEMEAKVVDRILFQGERWRPLQPIAARKVDSVTLDVDFNVPRGQLVIDTIWFQKLVGWGFQVYNGSIDAVANVVRPSNMQIIGPFTARFTLPSAMPSGAIIGTQPTSTYDLGTNPVVASTGAATSSPLGAFPRYALTITGDITALLKPLTDEGAVHISSGSKSGTVRAVSLVGGNTVLTGETRELTGAAFAAADALTFYDSYSRTNLRDTDAEASLYAFGDNTFGTRYGQSYPMWNWCVLFAGIPISGA